MIKTLLPPKRNAISRFFRRIFRIREKSVLTLNLVKNTAPRRGLVPITVRCHECDEVAAPTKTWSPASEPKYTPVNTYHAQEYLCPQGHKTHTAFLRALEKK